MDSVPPRAVRDLGRWAGGFGVALVEGRSEGGRWHVDVSRIDPAALNEERRRLLLAWLRRATDEQQIACAMRRIETEEIRRHVARTRRWTERVRARQAGPRP